MDKTVLHGRAKYQPWEDMDLFITDDVEAAGPM